MDNMTPFEMRLRQEIIYTIHVAQKVADGHRQISARDLINLDRYARWHFGVRNFQQLVDENREMLPPEKELPVKSRRRSLWNW